MIDQIAHALPTFAIPTSSNSLKVWWVVDALYAEPDFAKFRGNRRRQYCWLFETNYRIADCRLSLERLPEQPLYGYYLL